jgi:hypothetical protein
MPHMYAAVPKQDAQSPVDLKLAELQHEMDRVSKEREHVAAVKATLEHASKALEQERAAFEAQKVWFL